MRSSTKKGGKARARRLLKTLAGQVVVTALASCILSSAAMATTNWLVGLTSGSNSISKSAAVTNLTITAISSPSPTHLLYPHGSGDVVAKITNPNKFPVTITAVLLPKTTAYATGYSTATLTTTKASCAAAKTKSDVYWHYASSSTGSSHTLATAITVAAKTTATNDPLKVTFTNDAYMGTTASATCENTYFKMPSLKGVTAYAGGNVTPATSPTTDKWTS